MAPLLPCTSGPPVSYLLQWAVRAVSEKGQQVGPIILCVETDLLLVVALPLVMVSLEELV